MADSEKLDGQDSAAFLGANQTAADSNKLDGLDSTAFVGNGTAAGGDLSGTYPNPNLGSNTVGPEKVSDGSLDLADVAEATVKTTLGSLTAGGDLEIAPHTCASYFVPSTTADSGDLLLVDFPGSVAEGMTVSPAFVGQPDRQGNNTIHVSFCNVTTNTIGMIKEAQLRITIFDDGNNN